MQIPKKIQYALAILILVGGGVFWMKKSKTTASVSEPSLVDSEAEKPIQLSPDILQNHPVKYVKLTKEGDFEAVNVPGTVTYDLGKVARVGSRVAGRIVEIYANEGDYIKKGQTVFTISSIELGETEATYKKAMARREALLIQSERAKELYEKKVTSAKEYEMAMMEYKTVRTEAETSRNALENFGLSAGEIESLLAGKSYSLHLPIRSPISGTVTERNAVLGQAVSVRDNLFTVADLSTLWIILEVYEKDLNQIRIGNEAKVLPVGSKDEPVLARVAHVGEVIDPVKRSAEIRLVVKNAQGRLRPGQTVSAVLLGLVPSKVESEDFYTLPEICVHKIEGETYVFVRVPDGGFRAQKVKTGRVVEDRLEIIEGISAEDEVVSEGSFLLKSEFLKI